MVRRGGAVRVVARVGAAAAAAVACTAHARPGAAAAVARAVVIVVAQITRFRVPLVDDQVDRHLAFQAADVALAEVVAQFVDLARRGQGEREREKELNNCCKK